MNLTEVKLSKNEEQEEQIGGRHGHATQVTFSYPLKF